MLVPVLAPHVPAKPVKFTLLALAPAKNVSVYVPVVKLKEKLLASVDVPVATVVATAPELEMLTVGVPVTLKLVSPPPESKRVPPAAMQVMFPIPNAMTRTVVLMALKRPVVKVLPFRSSVPTVKLVVLVEPTVRASASRTVEPVGEIPRGKSIVLPLLVIVCRPEVPLKTTSPVLAWSVIVEERVRSP